MLNFLKSSLHLSETRREIAASYTQAPSISNKLPWMHYDPTTGCFHLDDGRSVAAVFELTNVATDTKSEDRLTQLESGLQTVLQDVFPLYFDEKIQHSLPCRILRWSCTCIRISVIRMKHRYQVIQPRLVCMRKCIMQWRGK
jgi:hypothetical protein